jgi:hypothetical protein
LIDNQKYRDEFDSFLDEDGEYNIGLNFSRFPSQILYEMDETAYYEQLTEYVNQKRDDYPQVVYQSFPAPIAYFFYQTEHGYENENHRLHLLRSTWESLIYILYALVLGEVNLKSFLLNNVRIFDNQRIRQDHNGLMSNRLGWKLEAMQKIIDYDQQQNKNLVISSYTTTNSFETIKELNQERNSFSHIAALSPQEAQHRFDELYPKVTDLLFELDFLENVSLLRFSSNLGDIHKIRFTKFDGHSLQGQNYDKTFLDSELIQITPILNDKIMLLKFDSIIFNVAPFIHFHFEGAHLKLCYFKRIDNSSGNYLFEIIGGVDREVGINYSDLSNCINISLGGLL